VSRRWCGINLGATHAARYHSGGSGRRTPKSRLQPAFVVSPGLEPRARATVRRPIICFGLHNLTSGYALSGGIFTQPASAQSRRATSHPDTGADSGSPAMAPDIPGSPSSAGWWTWTAWCRLPASRVVAGCGRV